MKDDRNIMCHERLAIVDPESGDQPLYAREDDSLVLIAVGEIYNHTELEELVKETEGVRFRTGSDCECILGLYQKFGMDFMHERILGTQICGMFGFVLLDQRTQEFVVARDPVGIVPLYYGYAKDGSFWVASEMKALVEDCVIYDNFPPGHVYSSRTQRFEPYLSTDAGEKPGDEMLSKFFIADDKNLAAYPAPSTTVVQPEFIRRTLERSVISHLMSDVPYGVLLSGGLDSSLVASIMAKNCRRRVEDGGASEAYYPRLL